MTRLPSLTPAQVVKALKRAGSVVIPGRGRGSDRVLAHPDSREVVNCDARPRDEARDVNRHHQAGWV